MRSVKDYQGTLFLVVGNSGSGKDSIITGAIEKYPSHLKKIYNPKRYITRPPSETEDNIPITESEFYELKKEGKFALQWYIYGLHYGVPSKIDKFLTEGNPVVINVSRSIISEARKQYKKIKVIFISVPLETTIKRIRERGREKGNEIEERIQRAKNKQEFSDADYIIINTGSLESAVDKFLDYIMKNI